MRGLDTLCAEHNCEAIFYLLCECAYCFSLIGNPYTLSLHSNTVFSIREKRAAKPNKLSARSGRIIGSRSIHQISAQARLPSPLPAELPPVNKSIHPYRGDIC